MRSKLVSIENRTSAMKPTNQKTANAIRVVMDPQQNALRELAAPQRFQIMVVLSVMWSTIFCSSFGAWYLYGELVIGHALVITGVFITALTFRRR